MEGADGAKLAVGVEDVGVIEGALAGSEAERVPDGVADSDGLLGRVEVELPSHYGRERKKRRKRDKKMHCEEEKELFCVENECHGQCIYSRRRWYSMRSTRAWRWRSHVPGSNPNLHRHSYGVII